MLVQVKKERLNQFKRVLTVLEEQNMELQKQSKSQKEALDVAVALLLDLLNLNETPSKACEEMRTSLDGNLAWF
jgi:hypothetical protein